MSTKRFFSIPSSIFKYIFLCFLPSYVFIALAWSIIVSSLFLKQQRFLFFLTDFLPVFGQWFIKKNYSSYYSDNGSDSFVLLLFWIFALDLVFILSIILFRATNKKKLKEEDMVSYFQSLIDQ